MGETLIATGPVLLNGPFDYDLLKITWNGQGNTLTLDPGATGRIGRIEIENHGGGDGIKIRPGTGGGAHDIVIEGGYVITNGSGVNHTDGLQAGAGARITIRNVAFIGGAPENGGNANFFTSGWGGGVPTDIVAEHCAFVPYSPAEQFSHAVNLGSPSVRCGARDCLIGQGDFFAITVAGGATEPVLEGNTVVMKTDPEFWTKCSHAAALAYVGEPEPPPPPPPPPPEPTCEERLAAMTAERDALAEQVGDLEVLLSDLQSLFDAVVAERDALRVQVADLQAEVISLTATRDVLAARVAELEAAVAGLEAQVLVLTSALDASIAEGARLGSIIDRAAVHAADTASVLAEK